MPDTILLEALDLMEQGLGVDDIIARYPEQAADLRPFLTTATALPTLAAQPSVTAQRDSRQAFLAEADRRAAEANAVPRQAGGWLWRLLAPALAALAIMFLGGAGLARASAAAVPGDTLYTTKRFFEETRINLSSDPERAAELREQFRLERIEEIERLLADGREADVSLTGEIVMIDGDNWVVDGVPVVVPAAADVEGVPFVGATVQIDGRTTGGALVANRVMLLAGAQPLPPTPIPPTPPPAPTQTRPAPTPTAEPVESQPGAQPVVPATQPPVATQPPPPPTPVFDDNGNDNLIDNGDFDDGGDDNDNGDFSGGFDDNDNDDFIGGGFDDNDNDDFAGGGFDDNDNDDFSGGGSDDNDNDDFFGGGSDDNSNDSDDDDDDDNDND